MRKITTLEALKQAEIKKMSFEDVFLSPQYKADLQGLVQTACRRVGYKGNVVLHTFFDEEKDDVAFTDGTPHSTITPIAISRNTALIGLVRKGMKSPLERIMPRR